MIELERIDDWLRRYRRAWESDARADIEDLFAPDVLYFTAPYRPPLAGVGDVVAYWTGERESRLPWTFEHEVLAQEGDLFVVRVVVDYPSGGGRGGGHVVYHDLWLVWLGPDGRATRFVEYFMAAD